MSHRLPIQKSGFNKRRKVIIYIVACILILGVVAGFTNNFTSDNRKFAAGWGETIVMEKELPASGTPADYDLISNLQFAAYKLHHAKFFRGETNGKLVADIKIGNYNQYIHNTRVALGGNKVFAETISSSSLKSVAEQKYAEDGIIIFRPSVSINGSSAKFANTAYQMSYEEYSQKYGTVPNQLSKYIINEKTILSVKDENAPAKAAVNSNGETEGFDFYVPEKLVRGDDGYYRFSLTLDAFESTLYYRNEVRTLGGADQNPKFHSVRVTVTIDDNWTPITVRSREVYDIALPVIGAMTCDSDLTEVFTDVDSENGTFPEEDFFRPYVEQAKSDPDYVPPAIDIPTSLSPADYLATAFADYMSGQKTLDLKADIKMGDFSAYDLKLSLNLKTMDIAAALGKNLYVKFGGGKIYINLGNINGYISTADFERLLGDERLAAMLGGLGDLDMETLFGGDMLEALFKNCEMTEDNGIVRIRLTFDIDLTSLSPEIGKITVDASLFINDSDKSLKSITGKIELAGQTIDAEIVPLKSLPQFPSTDAAVDLSGILDFIPDALSTAEEKTFEINGSIALNGSEIGISAYIDTTDGIDVDAVLSVLGLDISIKYTDGILQAEFMGIKVRGTADELSELLATLLDTVELDIGKYIDLLSGLMPTSLNDLVGMIKSLDVTDNALELGLNVLTVPIRITLGRGGGRLTDIGLTANVDMFGIKLDAAADFALSYPAPRRVELSDGEFISVSAFTELIESIKPYLDTDKNYTLSLDGSVGVAGNVYDLKGNVAIDRTDNGIALRGEIFALGQKVDIVYTNDSIYFAVGNKIKVKLDASDTDELTTPLKELIGLIMPSNSNVDLDVSGIIKHLGISESGAIEADLAIGNGININLDFATGTLAVSGNTDAVDLEFTATLVLTDENRNISEPTDADRYIDAAAFGKTIGKLTDIVREKALSFSVMFAIDGNTYNADIALSFVDGLALSIKEKTLPLDITVTGGNAYIAIGDIKIVGTLEDAAILFEKIKANLPDKVVSFVKNTLETVKNKCEEYIRSLDIVSVIDKAMSAITDFTIENDSLIIGIKYNDITINLNTNIELNDIRVNMFLPANTVGNDKNVSAMFMLYNVVPSAAIAEPDTSDYVPAAKFVSMLSPILPLIKEKAFDITLDFSLCGKHIIGNAYIDFGEYTADSVQAYLTLVVAGMPFELTVKNRTLYIDVNNGGIMIAQPLDKADISALISELETALEIDITAELEMLIKSIIDMGAFDIENILGSIKLIDTENGFTVCVSGDTAVTIAVRTEGNTGMDVAIVANGTEYNLSVNTVISDGVLSEITVADTEIAGISFGCTVGIAGTMQRDVTVSGTYIYPSELIKYIEPVRALVNKANGAASLTVDLDAKVTLLGKSLAISGNITVSFEPLAVEADLTLFADSADRQYISIVYVNGILYIETGKIRLSFDVANDLDMLYASIEKYIPDYLKDPNESLEFGGLSTLIEGIKKLANVADINSAFDILFDVNPINNKSLIKQVADMISVFKRGDDITLGVTVLDTPFSLGLNITPVINNGDLDVMFDTGLGSYVGIIGRMAFNFGSNNYQVTAPANADTYVPVSAFIKTVIDAVNTFTAKADDIITVDEYGNTTTVSQISFEADSFTFDYDIFKTKTVIDEFGNETELKDETGRPVIDADANGEKTIEQHISIGNKTDGNGTTQKFLRFGYTTTEVTDASGKTVSRSSKVAVEAHLKLDIQDRNADGKLESKIGFPIELDVYVAPTTEHPEGLAYIFYKESNGYGERISIDYNSVLQIVAAIMDIVGADDATVDELLKDYRLPIDTSLFDSMNIAGFDSIRNMLDGLVKALNEFKSALSDAGAAWDKFQNAGSIDNLMRNLTNDELDGEKTIVGDIKAAVAKIKTAIAAFGTGDETEPDDSDKEIEFNGALYGSIVDSIEFGMSGDELYAKVDNEIATGTSGWAVIGVRSVDNKLRAIGVDGLDVNTARLNTFDLQFAPTQNITIEIPSDYTAEDTGDYKIMHADFSNIKHLLFDVMNTANLMEFDIGGVDTSDVINLKLNLGALSGLANMDLQIRYNIKVKIIETGKDENGNAIYKTFAAVELKFQNCTAKIAGVDTVVINDCTTRLYFYDDVIYVQGYDIGAGTTNTVVGANDVQYDCKRSFKSYHEDFRVDYKADVSYNAVNVMYTVDELFAMINGDMSRFMKEFLFYLVPLSRSFTFLKLDLQQIIIDQIAPSGNNSPAAVNTQNTLAQIFKEYKYNGSKHTLRIGLKELAGSDTLSDLVISITGMNDGDDDGINGNILNNYISGLEISTGIQNNLIEVNLAATLNNIRETDNGNSIESKGFAPINTTVANGTFGFNGKSYALDYCGYVPDAIYTIDGNFSTAYADGKETLYTDYGSLPVIYRTVNGTDGYTATSSSMDNKPDGKGYKFGDTMWQYTFNYSLFTGYCLNDATTYQYHIGVDANGGKYVYRIENGAHIRIRILSITDDLLAQVTRDSAGDIVAIANRADGIQWSRSWKA